MTANRAPDSTPRAPLWAWAIGLLALVVAYLPTLRWLGMTWLGGSYHSHGAAVPLIAAWIAWRITRTERTDAPLADDGNAFYGGLVVLGGSLAVHAWATARQGRLLSALSLVSAIAGIVLALGGSAMLRRQGFPLAFMLLMVPLPWLESASPALARRTAASSVVLARSLGVSASVEGARVSLQGGALVVGAPCSGLNSLGALVTLSVLVSYLLRGPLWAKGLLILFSPGIALMANMGRIVLLLFLGHYVSVDVALRYFHDWSGYLLFLLALGALLAIGWGLGCHGLRDDI